MKAAHVGKTRPPIGKFRVEGVQNRFAPLQSALSDEDGTIACGLRHRLRAVFGP